MPILFHHLVRDAADRHGDRPAVTHRALTYSYTQVWSSVQRFGRGLHNSGLQRGDRVAIYLDKRSELVDAIFGTSVAGGVFIPVNPVAKARQVRHILDDSQARVLVTSSDRYRTVANGIQECKSVDLVVLVDDGDPGDHPTRFRISRWTDLLADRSQQATYPQVDSDVAGIFYTSGSTGRPKGVVLSHRNIVVGAQSVSAYLANTHDDVILAALPVSFDAGFSQLTTAFSVGAHVVLVNYLVPRDVIRLCAEHRVTGLTCVPPLWLQLADQDWPEDSSRHLRYFANTGGRMPKTTLTKLRHLFPQARPYLMYGLTEAFRSTYLDPAQVDRRPDSIGKAIPNAEILVVRSDGSLCDAGEEGELVHRGPLVSLGYWNDPERTAERFRPAPARPAGLCLPEIAVWSGDTVVRDDEGYLYFVGRSDEMIKTSGYRVSPTEIEEVAYDSGLIRDAVALGVEDPSIGQHIVLFVSGLAGNDVSADSLLRSLADTLPRYMVPRRVIVRDELPRSPNGKYDRQLLRRELGS